jgi:hypothetical protein
MRSPTLTSSPVSSSVGQPEDPGVQKPPEEEEREIEFPLASTVTVTDVGAAIPRCGRQQVKPTIPTRIACFIVPPLIAEPVPTTLRDGKAREREVW